MYNKLNIYTQYVSFNIYTVIITVKSQYFWKISYSLICINLLALCLSVCWLRVYLTKTLIISSVGLSCDKTGVISI